MLRPPTQRIRVAILRSGTVGTAGREAWLARTVEQGCDVLLCHSGLVEVGLDLLAFPTIVCAEVIFSTTRVRQATRRSYRPGQTQPVRVVQLVYDCSMEARGLQLIASKIKSSLMVEGKLPGEGLAAFGHFNGQSDLLLELARSVLADKEGGGARDVTGSLEVTFRELAVAEQEQDTYIGDVEVPAVVAEVAEEDLESPDDECGARLHPDDAASVLPVLSPLVRTALACGSAAPESELVTDDSLRADESVPRPSAAAPADDPWAPWRELRDRLRPAARPRHRAASRTVGAETLPGLPGTLWLPQPGSDASAEGLDGAEAESPTQREAIPSVDAAPLKQASLWG